MKFAPIIICGLLAIGTSCEKSKNRSGTYSCEETNSNSPDSTYQRTYEIDHYKRKSMNIYITEHHAEKLDYTEAVVYTYSVGDATYQVSVTATFEQDSLFLTRFSHHYYDTPMNTTITAKCLLDE